MVGGVVSVGFGLGGGGMRWVGDRCNAVGQGSRDHAFNPASGSREAPCCCDIDQPRRKPADTVRLDLTRLLTPARALGIFTRLTGKWLRLARGERWPPPCWATERPPSGNPCSRSSSGCQGYGLQERRQTQTGYTKNLCV